MKTIGHGHTHARIAVRITVLASLLVAAGAGMWGTVAHAHGGTAAIELQDEHPDDGGVHYILKATWDDGDTIEDATVNVAPTSPDGTQQTPVAMEPTGGGIYEATVDMPEAGTWTMLFTLLHPDAAEAATHTSTYEMEAPEPAEQQPPASEPEPTSTTAADDVDGAEAAEELAEEEVAAASDDSDDGFSLILVAAAFFVVGAIVGAAFWAGVGSLRRTDEDGANAW